MDPPVDVQALLLVLVHTGSGASFARPQRTERWASSLGGRPSAAASSREGGV